MVAQKLNNFDLPVSNDFIQLLEVR